MDRNRARSRLLWILGGAAVLVGVLILLAWASKKAQQGSANQANSADAQFTQAGGEQPGDVQLYLSTLNILPGGNNPPPVNTASGPSGPMPPQPAPGTAGITAAARSFTPVVTSRQGPGGPIPPVQPPRVNPTLTAAASASKANSAAISGHGPIPPSAAPGKGPIPPQPAPGRHLRRLPPVRRVA